MPLLAGTATSAKRTPLDREATYNAMVTCGLAGVFKERKRTEHGPPQVGSISGLPSNFFGGLLADRVDKRIQLTVL